MTLPGCRTRQPTVTNLDAIHLAFLLAQSVQPLVEAELTDEPDKNETSGGVRVRYTTGVGSSGEVGPGRAERTLPLFLKFQCGRGLRLWLQAVRSALEPGISREVQFYRRLAREVPVRVATPYVAEAAHWCNRVCLGLEYLGPSIPETVSHPGCPANTPPRGFLPLLPPARQSCARA